ncbi:MAG: hypothetical protein OEZ13_09545 [Spirochaetia bacterium]|nr:hypothetical protein [Spirochaetia bacterium]
MINENKTEESLDEIIEPVLFQPVLEELDEAEATEAPPWRKKVGPITAGLFSFFLGVLYFLPLESLAREALKTVNKSGTEISVGDISLSFSGNISMKDFQMPIDEKQSDNDLKIKNISGNLSVFSLLFSDLLMFQTEISGLELSAAPVEIKGGTWQIENNIENIKKKKDFWKGGLKITGSQVQVYYNEELPVISEKLAVLVDKIIIEGDLKDNTFYITNAQIESSDFNADITGNIRLMKQAILNALLTILPKDPFYERYKQMGLKEMITSMGFMNADGKIQINLSGNLSNPRPVVKKASSTAK